MHGAAFFCFGMGRGGAEEKIFSVGPAGAGQQLNSGQLFSPGPGRGRAGRGMHPCPHHLCQDTDSIPRTFQEHIFLVDIKTDSWVGIFCFFKEGGWGG